MKRDNEGGKKEKEKAAKVISTICGSLKNKYPGISHVLYYLKFIPVKEPVLFETDGMHIFYSPKLVMAKYREKKPYEMAYKIMHIVAHGLLGHFQIAPNYNYDIAMHTLMDAEAARFLEKLSMSVPASRRSREYFAASDVVRRIYKSAPVRSLVGAKNYVDTSARKSILFESRKLFWYDDHRLWYARGKTSAWLLAGMSGNADENENTDNQNQVAAFWQAIQRMVSGDDAQSADAEQILQGLLDVNPGANLYGNETGNSSKRYQAAKRARLDYGTYLKRFFRSKEREKEDEESIDKALYAWGFTTYGADVAFIEPELESQVKHQMDTVILAIDTSGSCCGDTMKQFLAETRELFRNLSTYQFHRFIVLQCDAEIVKEDVYQSAGDFPGEEAFGKGIDIYGRGGTDFVPVFQYADDLAESGEKVNCLIYLSDGYGRFPEEKPQGYETFFVLDRYLYDTQDEYEEDSKIPGWVTTLYL